MQARGGGKKIFFSLCGMRLAFFSYVKQLLLLTLTEKLPFPMLISSCTIATNLHCHEHKWHTIILLLVTGKVFFHL